MVTSRAAHRPSQRGAALTSALGAVREGETLSLESAARAAGLSKPGLMYHFPTKEALIAALIDHVIDDYEQELVELLPGSKDSPTTAERLDAYVRWALSTRHDAAFLVMVNDPRLRERMSVRWADRLRVWVEIPGDLPADQRARLHAARFIADGCWFADASNVLPLGDDERQAVLTVALELLSGDPT